MKTIQMKLGQRSYSIIIENDLIKSLGDYLKNKNTNQKWVIISQNAIMNHYGNDLFSQLEESGFDKNKMKEVETKLTYEDKTKNKKKTRFEMTYATVVKVEEENPDKEDVKKFILCDLQIKIYPQIEKIFLNILKMSGFPDIQLNSKIDFNKLYKERKI